MENREEAKRVSRCILGGPVCPYCNKWLAVQLEEKVIEGTVKCPECYRLIFLDKKICNEVNGHILRARRTLGYPRKKLIIYKGRK